MDCCGILAGLIAWNCVNTWLGLRKNGVKSGKSLYTMTGTQEFVQKYLKEKEK